MPFKHRSEPPLPLCKDHDSLSTWLSELYHQLSVCSLSAGRGLVLHHQLHSNRSHGSLSLLIYFSLVTSVVYFLRLGLLNGWYLLWPLRERTFPCMLFVTLHCSSCHCYDSRLLSLELWAASGGLLSLCLPSVPFCLSLPFHCSHVLSKGNRNMNFLVVSKSCKAAAG